MSQQHDWRAEAACAEIGTEMFYPDSPTAAAQAKRICHSCPVEHECLDWALTTGEGYGIWGGTTPKQRRALRRDRREVA